MSEKLDREEYSIGTSFEEKSVWVQMMSLIAVLVVYGFVAGQMMLHGVTHIVPYVPVFAIAVAMLVVLMIVGHSVAAIVKRPEARDERDRLIVWRAESNAGWVLGIGVLASLGGLAFSISNVWVAHVLLLSMFLSEIAKLGFQIIYYRRGMSL